MKKRTGLWAGLLTLTLALTACGREASGGAGSAPAGDETGAPGAASSVREPDAAGGETVQCTLVDGAEDGELLLARTDGGDSDVYRVSAKELPVTVDGRAAKWSELTDGMELDVTHSGDVLESFPAQLDVTAIDAKTPIAGGYTDLCGFYLQVLEDLWTVDSGLNSDGEMRCIGVDLSDAPGGLSDAEKSAVAWRFAEKHEKQLVTGTYQELAEQGYIDGEHLQWEDGCLFAISRSPGHETERCSRPALRFDAQKWRSGTGAYFFSDCTALWPESGSWSTYRIGAQAIS